MSLIKKLLSALALSISVLLVLNANAQNKNVQTLNYSHGVYVGEVAGGKANGQGTYTAAKSGTIYSGQFTNDSFNGQGTMTWKNGDRFVGTWQNDSAISGIMTFSNGKTAQGTVQNAVFKELGSSSANSGKQFPKEVIGNWGPTKQACIAEITKDGFEEGGGIIYCTPSNMKFAGEGFSATLNCSADGHPNKRSMKFDGSNLIVDRDKYVRCKP